ncbi:hypothetical protein HanPI659440_Chr11g0419991 [Helianthus annuus]|nr:hypothetical protein HanPI659440_Chr11g0419991 [Helianthus annuus]
MLSYFVDLFDISFTCSELIQCFKAQISKFSERVFTNCFHPDLIYISDLNYFIVSFKHRTDSINLQLDSVIFGLDLDNFRLFSTNFDYRCVVCTF